MPRPRKDFALKRTARLALLAGLAAALGTGLSLFGRPVPAAAQTVAPMKKIVPTFGDRFLIDVEISHPYESRQLSEIQLFADDWTPIDTAILSHRRAVLVRGDRLRVIALVPMTEGRAVRHVYLCHSIIPRISGRGAAYRGEVCGKYSALRLS